MKISLSESRAPSSTSSSLPRLAQDLLGVEPAAVVGYFHEDVAGLVTRFEQHARFDRLAGENALLGRFDAMVDGVSHHVHQRIRQFLDDVPVELGFFAEQLEFHLFARFPGKVPHQARHFLEKLADGDHAHGHCRSLHVSADAGQLRKIARETLLAREHQIRIVFHQRLRDHHLSDHVDQKIELSGVHLDRAGFAGPGFRLRRVRRLRRLVPSTGGLGQAGQRGRHGIDCSFFLRCSSLAERADGGEQAGAIGNGGGLPAALHRGQFG